MVHALEEVHRLLMPAGRLIDIHPAAEPSIIEIHRNKRVEVVGNLMVRQWCVDFQQADQALAQVIEKGLFAIEREEQFDALTCYRSPKEMRADFNREIQKYARDSASIAESTPIVEELSARADELLQSTGNGAKLIRRERTGISRMRPIKAD